MRRFQHGTLTAAVLAVLLAGCSAGDEARDEAGDEAVDEAGEATEQAPTESSSRSTSPGPGRPPEEQPVAPPPSPDPDPAQQAELDRRLIAAAWDGDVGRARALIARGADVNAQDETRQSAYLIATSEGYLELLELTLRNGADVDAKDSFDGTGLIRAAERGHHDIVGRLIQAGAVLDHVNNLGWTALHEAIILGDGSPPYMDTIRVLVAAGADVQLASSRDGVAPLEHATARGQVPVAELLRAARQLDDRPGPQHGAGKRLLDAAAQGDPDAAALALRAGAGLEVRDEQQRTPLLRAATFDRVAVARLLVALGGDPDALDAQHDTPWLVTGVTGSVAMAETLLPARPDLTIRNRFGGLSVIPASERGHVDYVRRVVRTPIDVDHVNDLGWTALLEAVILGDGSAPYQEIVRILLAAGADPAIPDAAGVSALEHAEDRGQDAVARILRRAR